MKDHPLTLDERAARVAKIRADHDKASKEVASAEKKRDALGVEWAAAEQALREAVRPFVGLLSDEKTYGEVTNYVGCGCYSKKCPKHAVEEQESLELIAEENTP